MTNISQEGPNGSSLDERASLDALPHQALAPQLGRSPELISGRVHGVRGGVKKRVLDRFYDNPCNTPRGVFL